MRNKSCLTCGTPFAPKRRDARYCKAYCRLVAFRKRDELIVDKADRELRYTLAGVSSGRLTGAQAKARLAEYLLDGVKIQKDVRDLIQTM